MGKIKLNSCAIYIYIYVLNIYVLNIYICTYIYVLNIYIYIKFMWYTHTNQKI